MEIESQFTIIIYDNNYVYEYINVRLKQFHPRK